jgi:uncharacterized protein YqcC (DUF446 family)
MQIQFEEPRLQELQHVFNQLDPEESIFMNHYQLSKETGISAIEWKDFLLHPKVNAWFEQELTLYKQHQLKQMIKDATDDKRSVGAAQMMNSLTKALQDTREKEGPIIIYTHVPLTAAQRAGTTIETMELDENLLASLDWDELSRTEDD